MNDYREVWAALDAWAEARRVFLTHGTAAPGRALHQRIDCCRGGGRVARGHCGYRLFDLRSGLGVSPVSTPAYSLLALIERALL